MTSKVRCWKLYCNTSFINSIASIITHIYTGVGNVNGSRLPGVGGGGLRLIGPPPDESSVSMIVEMGFSRARAEEALRQVDNSSVEMAMEWLFSHPEEIRQVKELDSDVLGHFSFCVVLRCCLLCANKYFFSYMVC